MTYAADMRRLIFLLMLGSALPALAFAADNSYREYSDDELTALAADWDSLDRYQRRALLTEMKLRMARNGERDSALHIRSERRYGRLIRKSDGRVIRIETQVVHVRPLKPEDLKARQSFGIGFEHRVGQQSDEPPDSAGDAELAADDQRLTLEDVLDSLAPSTQAPVLNRPPIYQASDPKR